MSWGIPHDQDKGEERLPSYGSKPRVIKKPLFCFTERWNSESVEDEQGKMIKQKQICEELSCVLSLVLLSGSLSVSLDLHLVSESLTVLPAGSSGSSWIWLCVYCELVGNLSGCRGSTAAMMTRLWWPGSVWPAEPQLWYSGAGQRLRKSFLYSSFYVKINV